MVDPELRMVREADLDFGVKAGTAIDDQARVVELESGNPELTRVNEILKRAASSLGVELGRQHKT